ncbi:MAG: polysaccharide deacetylase family protein, partial [Acidobacteria bacterium]|nr:polysaccharide deacetylase family protein [Acidobacteriota bacterium]
ERHIAWLGTQFHFVSLDAIGARALQSRPFTEPVAAITFDDGYRDVYEHAFPILQRKGIPAAVFVVTDLVGQPFWQVHDRLYRLVTKAFATWPDAPQRLVGLLTDLGMPAVAALRSHASTASPLMAVSALLPSLPQSEVSRVIDCLESSLGNGAADIPLTLTWSQIVEMRRAGFTIGSHTRTHASLPTESPQTLADELAGSKAQLERHLGEAVAHFAYPGGQFTPRVVDALAQTGYTFGYTACPHHDPRYPLLTMERLLLWEGSSIDGNGEFAPAILNCQAHDLWPPARRCGRLHG